MHDLRSELSAQRINAPVNPLVSVAMDWLAENDRINRVADQGCGKLRHLNSFRRYSEVYLVDTEAQLSRAAQLASVRESVRRYVAKRNARQSRSLETLTDQEFANTSLGLDAVFAIAVYDVVPPRVRGRLAAAARRNLRGHGKYVVISPRNDSSRLVRCTVENAYGDGHVFAHHGAYTFWTNLRDVRRIKRLVTRHGFREVVDLSVYRQVCVIFEAA